MSVSLPEYIQDLQKELGEPAPVWKYMLAVTQIPRGSNMGEEMHKHLKILAFLKEKAEELGCEAIVDKGQNLIIRKPASAGSEDKPTVCLQCHMDMVVQKNDDVVINFDTDPLTPRILDGYLRATGTSLGADNGIGIAACFAILEDKTLKHGPLEILVTRDEETGLYGAQELEPGVLKAKYMINVDSEEEGAVCVGCAGGFTIHHFLNTPREAVEGYVMRNVVINNFVGGHSGVDIDLGRANPNHVMARLLTATKVEYRMVSFECGTAHNAIPRKAAMVVAVPAADAETFAADLKKEFDLFYHEYKTIEAAATFECSAAADVTLLPITVAATRQAINFLHLMPFGPIRMSPITKGTPETSITCAVASTADPEKLKFISSVRSFSESQKDWMYSRLKTFGEVCGMEVSEMIGSYPGWEPNVESPLTKATVAACREAFDKEPKVYAIHAGLECGLFMTKYPNLDCCSIGPELNFPHSPDERLLIESVPRFYNILVKILANLA